MGKIPIDKLASGMILAADVRDRSGRLLLGSGETLNDKHLRMFRGWGILEADIASHEARELLPPVEPQDNARRLEALESELKPLFRNTDLAHPAMGELFQLCLQRKFHHDAR